MTDVDEVLQPRVAADLHGKALFGRYIVIDELGTGGMGIVYRAYDPKLHREVALKCIRSGSLATEAKPRLLREARAMAKLSHPHVVAVYDVELFGDDVVLAMEYVRGRNFSSWISTERPGWSAVVQAFVAAGRGLAAAHAAGLLHRDFKPANVLLGDHGRVRVTDFGLAVAQSRLHEPRGSPEASSPPASSPDESWTRAGTVLGTPPYMAPEQHIAGHPLDARADQYAFCVSLWQCLTGELPYAAGHDGAVTLAERKLLGPPAWPGHVDVPSPIVSAIRRGLAASPADRWPAMEPLLEALTPRARHSWTRLASGAGLTSALIMVGGAFALWHEQGQTKCSGAAGELAEVWDEQRQAAAKAAVLATHLSYAEWVWARTAPQLQRYADDWASMHRAACEATAVTGEQSEAVLDLRMNCLRRAKMSLRATTDQLLIADSAVLENAHKLLEALPRLAQCEDTDALRLETPPPHTAQEAERIANVRDSLATVRARLEVGKYDEAMQAVEAALTRARDVHYEPLGTELALAQGIVLKHLGRFHEAEVHLQGALSSSLTWGQWADALDSLQELLTVVGDHLARSSEGIAFAELALGLGERPQFGNFDRVRTRSGVAVLQLNRGRYDEAETEIRRAIALLESTPGFRQHDVAALRANLAAILDKQDRGEEAELENRRSLTALLQLLGPDHPDVAIVRNNLANLLRSQGRLEEAESEYLAVLKVRERVLGPKHPDVALTRSSLAALFRTRGRHEEAEQESRAALRIWEDALQPGDPDLAIGHHVLATVLHVAGKYDEAEVEYRKAIEIGSKALGAEHPDVTGWRNNLAMLLERVGRLAEAELEYWQILEAWEHGVGTSHPQATRSRGNLAALLERQGRYVEAEAQARKVLALRERTLQAGHPELAIARHHLANILRAQGRVDQALTEFDQALAILENASGGKHPWLVHVLSDLGETLLSHRPRQALSVLERAHGLSREIQLPPRQPGQRWGPAEVEFALARALRMNHAQPQRARQLASEALVTLRRDPGTPREELDRIEVWLRQDARR